MLNTRGPVSFRLTTVNYITRSARVCRAPASLDLARAAGVGKGPRSPFIPANPSMRSSVGRSSQCSVDRLHFFFSFEFSYLRVPRKPRLGGAPDIGNELSEKPLADRAFVVQNGIAWS